MVSNVVKEEFNATSLSIAIQVSKFLQFLFNKEFYGDLKDDLIYSSEIIHTSRHHRAENSINLHFLTLTTFVEFFIDLTEEICY